MHLKLILSRNQSSLTEMGVLKLICTQNNGPEIHALDQKYRHTQKWQCMYTMQCIEKTETSGW